MDGERSLYDISLAISAEYGFIDPAHVKGFFGILEKAGLVRMKTP